VGVGLVGGALDRGGHALAAAVAGIVVRAGVAVVARRAGVRGHRAARCAVAGAGVALVTRAGNRRADALPAAVAGIVVGAGVAVVAGGADMAVCKLGRESKGTEVRSSITLSVRRTILNVDLS